MVVESLFNPLPQHWSITTLGEACAKGGGDVQTGPFGSQLHASDYVPVGIPSIMPKNIGDNRIDSTDIARISTKDAERLSKYLVEEGDIVYSRRGDVEKRALVRKQEKGWLCGTGCLRVRVGNKTVDPIYTFYYLGHPLVKDWIVRHAIGATMPNLNTSILSDLPFVIPPLPEQKAIAHILGTLDDKIELNRRMNETIESMARAIFKSWFVDFLPVRANMGKKKARTQTGDPVRVKAAGKKPVGMDKATATLFPNSLEDSPLGKIPKGWRVKTIADICHVSRGASPRPIHDFMYGEVPWIKIADASASIGPFIRTTKELLKKEGVTKSVSVEPGDLILSNSATCGIPVFVEIFGCIHDGWLLFRELKEISKFYLYHHLVRIAEDLVRIADGSVQKNLNTKLVSSQKIVIPSSEISEIFDTTVKPLFDAMLENVKQTEILAALRDTLLPKLLSGELRVKDAERFIEKDTEEALDKKAKRDNIEQLKKRGRN